jgi:putative phage-type endonuclease
MNAKNTIKHVKDIENNRESSTTKTTTSGIDLEARKTGIGGSDIAVVLGINPYKTVYELYEEKVNGFTQDLSNNEKVIWGNLLEEPIAQRYQQLTGKALVRSEMVRHAQYPFLIANPDRLIVSEKKGLEIKAVGENTKHLWGESGSQIIPDYYYVQAAHYMLVLDYQEWDVAALIGGQELRIYSFERDKEMDELIISKGSEFWYNHVQKQVAPAIDYAKESVQQLIKRKNPVVSELSIELADEYIVIANQLENAKENIKHYDSVRKEAEAKLLNVIGEAGRAVLPNGRFLFRKRVERRAYQVPGSSYITLGLNKIANATNQD